ncbi:hypothetical protein BGZ95_011626 [Linnemannia exigua]|uniref:DUF4460 domain-containing protein n=1 Tax=Linnemannia exigua TaxID=604196 RepID=A0AAD4D9N2_9FUNG|nr:hypothetical protein BGZ95_011626 [Linnemannia exigua]
MRTNIAKSTAASLRQNYLQQYLKQFLRRVHPDLFQHHPKEQLQNSAALQDLLPIVSHDKNKGVSLPNRNDTQAEVTKKLAFYYRTKDAGLKSNTSTTTPGILAGSIGSPGGLKLIEHTLPLVHDSRIPSTTDSGVSSKQDLLEREVKSWEMVQSFVELCRKVGVPVKAPDQEDISSHLEESIKNVETAMHSKQQKQAALQKPVSEIFIEELQSSFSGSSGHVRTLSSSSPSMLGGSDIHVKSGFSLDTISSSHHSKIGGSAPALDAQLMIQSNPLLFKSPAVSSAKLSKTIRTWIHWQDEDQHLLRVQNDPSSVAKASGQKPFRLGDWWRKVPIMILSSSEERAETLKAAAADPSSGETKGQPIKGMLIIHQDMSKQEITEYLDDNMDRIQREYKEMLQKASPKTKPRRATVECLGGEKTSVSAEAASYLERMRARSQGSNRATNKRWR